jgi:hypothetical protein
MADYITKQGSTLPFRPMTLTDDNGDPEDITLASTVVFKTWPVGREDEAFTMDVEILDLLTGRVQIIPGTGDTDLIGVYEGHFSGLFSSKEKTWPSEEFLTWEVIDNGEDDEDDPLEPLVYCTIDQAHGMGRRFRSLTHDELYEAQLLLSIRTGVEPATDEDDPTDYDDLYDQDKVGLKQATAILAIWLRSQPDYFERLNVSSENADGEGRHYIGGSMQFPPAVEWALGNTRFRTSGDYMLDTPRDRTLVPTFIDIEEIGWGAW